MYHPTLIAERTEALFTDPQYGFAGVFPHGRPEYSLDDARALTAQIMADYDPDAKTLTRRLLPEEDTFIAYAKMRIGVDAIWYLQTFVYIDEEGHGLRPLYPLWPSQQFVLDRLGALELRKAREGDTDGILLNILKVRQVGISTLGMGLVSHRILTQPYIRAIAGSDTEEQARYLFRMVERIYDQLPYFLKPDLIPTYSSGRELTFATRSSLKTAWGKSTRGALQDVGGKKGNIERGRTNSVVHISELATWDNPEQLDSSLLPGIPRSPKTLVLFESTAELAGDWWHRHWSATAEGEGRFANIFIPWCVKYESPAPADWSPNTETLSVATAIERDSFSWVGETLHPTRNQLYWYETERAYFAKKNQIHDFFKEFPSNPVECVVGDTRVATNQGLIPIAEAYDAKYVESGAVTQWWNRGSRPTFLVRTKAGREFSATAEHLVARTDGSWTAVSDLQSQDDIALSPPTFLVTDYHTVRWAWAPICRMEVTIDEDFARLLGFFLGDGSWASGGIEVACCAKDEDVVAEVARLIERVIGRAPRFRRQGKFGGCTSVRSSNKRWWQIFWHLGLLDRREDGQYHKRLHVPACIWRSPRTVVAAFLSGLFESDGHANKTAVNSSLFSKSEDLIREVQLLLLGFGINAAYHTAVKHMRGNVYTGRHLQLNAHNTVRFHAEIGFVGQRKRSQVLHLGGRGHGGRKALPITMTDQVVSVVPAGVQAVYDLGVDTTHYFGANGVKVHNCFMYAGRSVFTHEEIERIDHAARKVIDVWAVEPARDIAELKRFPDADDPKSLALQQDTRPAAPLATRVSPKSIEEHPVPPGYGFRRLSPAELEALSSTRKSVMAIFEYPRVRGRRRYVLGVDVGDGLQQDYSVVTVVRQPTIEEPAEEVAQYISNTIKPSHLAFVCDAIGRYYHDEDGIEACAAIELNNHGVTVQDLLQLHLGYTNFYVWEVVDAANQESRFTKRIGWITTTRTRPILLEKFRDGITTSDPISGLADFRLNSPITRAELRYFVTDTTLGEAEHARSQHDDCIFASAIGYIVAWRLTGGESEPIAEKRRRRDHLKLLAEREGGVRRDWRNSSVLASAANEGTDDEDDGINEPDNDQLYFNSRNSA